MEKSTQFCMQVTYCALLFSWYYYPYTSNGSRLQSSRRLVHFACKLPIVLCYSHDTSTHIHLMGVDCKVPIEWCILHASIVIPWCRSRVCSSALRVTGAVCWVMMPHVNFIFWSLWNYWSIILNFSFFLRINALLFRRTCSWSLCLQSLNPVGYQSRCV
jgi:hypothetical protein